MPGGLTPTGSCGILPNENHLSPFLSMADDQIGGRPGHSSHRAQQETQHDRLAHPVFYRTGDLPQLIPPQGLAGAQRVPVSRLHDLLDTSYMVGERFTSFDIPHHPSFLPSYHPLSATRVNHDFGRVVAEEGEQQEHSFPSREDVSMNSNDRDSQSLGQGKPNGYPTTYPFDGYPTNDRHPSFCVSNTLGSTSTLARFDNPCIQPRDPANAGSTNGYSNLPINAESASPTVFADRLVSIEGADVETFQALAEEESPSAREDSGDRDGEGEDENVVSKNDLQKIANDPELQRLCYRWVFRGLNITY